MKTGSGEIIGRDTAIDVYLKRMDGTEVSAALVVTTIVEDGRRWFIGGFMRRIDTVAVNEERTIVAAERQAHASERLADQGDVLHSEDVAGRSATAQERIADASDTMIGRGGDQTDVAERIEVGRADGHAAGRVAERVIVNTEVQAGHDAGLAEGRAEDRPTKENP